MSFKHNIQGDTDIIDYLRQTNEAIIRGPIRPEYDPNLEAGKSNIDELKMEIRTEPDFDHTDSSNEPSEDLEDEFEPEIDEAMEAWAEGEKARAQDLANAYEGIAARLRVEPGYADYLERSDKHCVEFDIAFDRKREAQARRDAALDAENKARGEQKQRRRLMSRADHRDLPPPQWLVEGLIPENADVAIYAPFAFLKSFVALDLAMSVAMGCKALQMGYRGSGGVGWRRKWQFFTLTLQTRSGQSGHKRR